jgi:hypothetical protein
MSVLYTMFPANTRSNRQLKTMDVSSPHSNNHAAHLGWILVQHGWVSQAQLDSALETQSFQQKPLGEMLLEQHLISEADLHQALKEQYWRRNGYWVI